MSGAGGGRWVGGRLSEWMAEIYIIAVAAIDNKQ